MALGFRLPHLLMQQVSRSCLTCNYILFICVFITLITVATLICLTFYFRSIIIKLCVPAQTCPLPHARVICSHCVHTLYPTVYGLNVCTNGTAVILYIDFLSFEWNQMSDCVSLGKPVHPDHLSDSLSQSIYSQQHCHIHFHICYLLIAFIQRKCNLDSAFFSSIGCDYIKNIFYNESLFNPEYVLYG